VAVEYLKGIQRVFNPIRDVVQMKVSEIAHTVLVTVTMVRQFLRWVLSDGRLLVPSTGFSNVTKKISRRPKTAQ
jgi:hypothetical protein